MACTLLYEQHSSPLGEFREAAVYETVEEALLQAGWDENVGVNRWPERIIEGAHHGSPGWEPRSRHAGRPRYVAEQTLAHDSEARTLADLALIERAAAVVRKHYVVSAEDALDSAWPGFGVPKQPAFHDQPSPSVEQCLAELRSLLS